MIWRILDMFSGIGAFTIGLERAGMQPSAFVEIDPFCRDVLARHWPGVPIHEDARSADFPPAEVICGGFPCTDVSRAGKRAGLAGADSGLYRELVRAFRLVRPLKLLMENVAALLDDGMDTVLGDLAEGRDCRWVEWDCVPAIALGACHERDRVWIVAHLADTDSIDWRPGPGGQAISTWDEPTRGAEASGPADAADAAGERCGQGRPGRPPDSFARIRDEARRNAADPHGARLAFRAGLGRDAWEELTAAQRSAGQDVEQSIWPDEPALSGVDDAIEDWMDRTKATGNTLDPLIPELIGRAILEQSQ